MALSRPSTSGESDFIVNKRERFRGQSRNIIFNVYSFLKKLSSKEEREKIDFSKTQELTVQACGKGSLHTVCRIVQEAKQFLKQGKPPKFTSPGKKHDMKKRVTNLDDFQKSTLRRSILSFYDRGEFPTAKKLVQEMKDKINYNGSVSSMYTILKNIGFKYKKTNDGRKFLMERRDIVAARIKFLRKMNNLRVTGHERPIFYLDETWINQNHTKKYIWQDSFGNGGLKIPTGKGNRLIVCHAGSAKTGFVNGSKWVFRSQKNVRNMDYHSAMNADTFKDWFVNRFLNQLEEGSIIIMDNAKYHSVLFTKIPNTGSRVREIQDWLTDRNIYFDPTETKAELLLRVEPFKRTEAVYELDIIAEERGHHVIRLPPYHCQYNPIELIWAKVKGEVSDKNKTFRLVDVEKLMNEALDRVTVEDWVSRVRHAEKLQQDDFLKEIGRDEIMQPMVINLMDDDDESEMETDSDSDESDDILAVPLQEDMDTA